MGNQIFNEITQQNDLIDDIDDRVENVNQRLINTNDNIATRHNTNMTGVQHTPYGRIVVMQRSNANRMWAHQTRHVPWQRLNRKR